MSRAKKQLKARRRRERTGHVAKVPPPLDPARSDVIHLAYTITEEAIHLPEDPDRSLSRALSDDDRAAIHQEVHNDPSRAIERLEPLLERFPDAPMVLNWLAAAYSKLGQRDKAEEVVRLNYERNPNYLFARANYADICLARGDLDRVREVFDDKFDLKLMYPHRDVSHVTEFVAFAVVVIEYFARTGESEAARRLFDVLEQVAPEHPSTKRLKLFFMQSLMVRALDRLRRGIRRRVPLARPGRVGC
jgi:tetratricopeptide (TPR) repeat protein